MGKAMHAQAAAHVPMDGVVRSEALRLFSEVVRELGGDPDQLLSQSRIEPASLAKADALISYRSMIHLLERAAVELKCPDFGLRLASRQGGIAVLGPLEIAMRNSSTVGEAYRYCAGHLQVYSPVVHIQIERERGAARLFMRFEILLDRVPNQRQAVENALALTHQAVLALSGGRFGAREVWFTHERLLLPAAYRRYFDGPVRFGQPFNAVFFNSHDLALPIPDQDPRLYEMASSFIESQYPSREIQFVPRVRTITNRMLAAGSCTHVVVARRLGMHPRTLQRRLREEGTSFDMIKDSVRRDAAARYLRESDMPMTRIAVLLGYSESSVLTRSCKRWFSSSPRQIRESGASMADPA